MSEVINFQDFLNDPELFLSDASTHAKIHSKKIDKALGFEINKIEQGLLQKYQAYFKMSSEKSRKEHFQGTQTWIGIHPQTLQTPYEDIYKALKILKTIEVNLIVDIGSAYGRVGIVSSCLFPQAIFKGYEVVKERTNEANRVFEKLTLSNAQVVQSDVLDPDFRIPKAEVYFIYDFSEPDHIDYLLKKLIQENLDSHFFIVCRGYGIEEIMQKQLRRYWDSNGFLEAGQLKIFKFTKLSNQ